LFSPGARPHVFFAYSASDLADLSKPEILRDLRDHAFGAVVFFESLYTTGAIPADRRYVFTTPAVVHTAISALHDYGFEAIMYIHGGECLRANMTPFMILDLIAGMRDEFSLDGVYFDYAYVSGRPEQIVDFLVRVRNLMPGRMIHHDSIEPIYGRVFFRGPWHYLFTDALWGETNPPPASLDDPLWRHQVSRVELGGHTIGMYKPQSGSPWETDWSWLAQLPALRCTARASFGEHYRKFKEVYWPAYVKERDKWQAQHIVVPVR
jgi:hypothetical protein